MNPTLTRDAAEKLARSRGCQDKVMILGLRAPISQYGVYDDILALLTPDSYTEWKGNTLPSVYERLIARLEPGDYLWAKGLHGQHHFDDIVAKFGKTPDEGKAIVAKIKAFYEAHTGQPVDYPEQVKNWQGTVLPVPYCAFRQAGPVVIRRADTGHPEKDGWPDNPAWIDGHRGGWVGTSSAGCQTFFPDHWEEARAAGYKALDQYGQKTLTYSLHQL